MSFLAQAQQMVGPKPPGDPSQMLEGAGQLLSLAAELESQASAMASNKIAGGGPFVMLASAAAAGDAGTIQAAAARLQEASSAMRAGAAKVEADQRRWKQQVEKVAGELEHEMRRATGS